MWGGVIPRLSVTQQLYDILAAHSSQSQKKNYVNVEQIFFEVFKDLPFPYFAIDLGRLNKSLSRENGTSPLSHIVVPLDVAPDKRQLLASSWRGFLSNAKVPYQVAAAIAGEAPLSKSSNGKALLRSFSASPRSSLKVDDNGIRWEQESFWPIAFSTMLGQSYMLVALHFILIQEHRDKTGKSLESKGFDRSALMTRSEFPRLLPTRHQFAFASLGAWLAGTENLQYLGYYATIRQIHHGDLNGKYLERMGFDEKTTTAMRESGLIAVPAELLGPLVEAQGSSQIFGSLPIDEQNFANPPAIPFLDYFERERGSAMRGILVDKYYRSPFWARGLESHGLFGAANVLRDHYEDFYASVIPDGLLRCKHYCVPIIEVSSVDDLRRYVTQIPVRHDAGVFFRGQTQLHTLQRNDDVKKLFFADSCSDEPSLTTSASRDLHYDYDVVHYALRQFAEQSLYTSDRKLIAQRTERWREEASSPLCRLDYAIMALAQHYGLPSHGLDVTTSEDVAVWFATNTYRKDSATDIAEYKKLLASDWSNDPLKWPVVFVCQAVTNSIESSLQDCQELEEFGIAAQRPERQHARFFHGGHSDHQNRLAEAVVCVFRLRPNFYDTKSTFATLFPGPNEDPAYKLMLEFAEKYASSWGRYINRFHFPSGAGE